MSHELWRHDEYIIYFLLSQREPVYPGRHVQRYPVLDSLPTHDPLLKHGEDKQMSTEIIKVVHCIKEVDPSLRWNCWNKNNSSLA